MSWSDTDHMAMQAALAEAGKAQAEGEVPIGAVIVDAAGRIIARGYNQREASQLVTDHAELKAITAAEADLHSWRLTGCTLYVTLEPCFMCAAAVQQAQIARVVYAAADPKQGAVESQGRFFIDHKLNHAVEAHGGLLADEASRLLRDFFSALRRRNRTYEEAVGGRGSRRQLARQQDERGHPDTVKWLESESEGPAALEQPDKRV